MYSLQTIHGLQLDDDTGFDDEIETVLPQWMAAILQDDWHFPLHHQSGSFEFDDHRILIDPFEKARPQPAVHLNRAPDRRLRDAFSRLR